MPKAIPNPQPQWGQVTRHPELQKANNDNHNGHSPSLGLAPLDDDLLAHPAATGYQAMSEATDLSEREKLSAENKQLRELVEEMQHVLDESSANEHHWAVSQKEYEGLIEEKSELIRNLHLKLKEFEDKKPAAPVTPKEEELLAMSEELEQERREIDRERRQLEEELRQFKEDEKSMTDQMREMEVHMARDRAELARQRHDLQQILDEIRHEFDRIERDRGLNEKLSLLRQRYQEVDNRKSGGPPMGSSPAADASSPPRANDRPTGRKDSGFFRRMFGPAES